MTPEQEQEMKEAQQQEQEIKEALRQILSRRVENALNDAVDSFGLNNDDLKKILQQVIVDIDRGFVGEPC